MAPDSTTDHEAEAAFAGFALALGDDALVLGHRLSEWCGVAPTLEEDIALSNIGLDLVGRADRLLGLAGRLGEPRRTSDELAYFRDATAYRNVALVELPKGDFAFTIMRQFLFDAMSVPLNERLAEVGGPLAGIAAKSLKESRYHLRHTSMWVRRFGGGTDESRARAQSALDELWMYTEELFDFGTGAAELVEAGYAPDPASLRPVWEETVRMIFDEAGLSIPDTTYSFGGAREGRHTEYLGRMLSEMQSLARAHPGAEW